MNLRKNIAVSESGFVFDTNTGDSFSLNQTGGLIIKLIQEGKNELEISNYFVENYEVDAGGFENNFSDFIDSLKRLNLLESTI